MRQASATLPLTYSEIVAAAARIDGVAYRTPILTSWSAVQNLGASAFSKRENFQRAGAFLLGQSA